MAAPSSCTSRSFVLVQSVCILVLTVAATNSVSLETEILRTYNLTKNEIQSTFSTSHGYQSLKISTGRRCPTRPWSMRITRLRHQDAAPGASSQARRPLLKDMSDYYHIGTALVVSLDGTAEYTDTQDAIDHEPCFNMKRVTIYVASGIYAEAVIIPASKPYQILQGDGRSNRTIISWHVSAASAGTLMSTPVIIESDHFMTISTLNTAKPSVPSNKTNTRAAAIHISRTRPFCLGAISTVTKTPCLTITVVIATTDALSTILKNSIPVVVDLLRGLHVYLWQH